MTALVGATTYLLGTVLASIGSSGGFPSLTIVGFGSTNSYILGSLLVYWPPALLVFVDSLIRLVRGRNLLLGGGMCFTAGFCSLTSMLALFGFFHEMTPTTPMWVAIVGASIAVAGGIVLVTAGVRAR
ncbi:MAG: hypothetical protein M3P11_08445 [Actinomycetota bacterium]|nr:hypothetical protein [Actinomycetota bacterium]